MMKVGKIITNIVLILAVIAFGYLGYWYYSNFLSDFAQIKDDLADSVEQIKSEINTPGPLVEDQARSRALTIRGIIEETNNERVKRGLSALTEDPKLDKSAKVKALDMINNQYFAHQSPAGLGVDDLVEDQGYSFLIVGENLAMGNFDGDSGVVEAWMNSKGHRENILKESYSEIGVGVIEGQYQGRLVWMAVQHFGTPQSICDSPDSGMKKQIDINKSELANLEIEIERLKTEVENASSKEDYRSAKKEYNQAVVEYNSLVGETESLTDQYNRQVEEYNQCLSSI